MIDKPSEKPLGASTLGTAFSQPPFAVDDAWLMLENGGGGGLRRFPEVCGGSRLCYLGSEYVVLGFTTRPNFAFDAREMTGRPVFHVQDVEAKRLPSGTCYRRLSVSPLPCLLRRNLVPNLSP